MTTGTIQFQAQEDGILFLKSKVKSLLYPDEYPEDKVTETITSNDPVTQPTKAVVTENISIQYLDGKFEGSKIIIEIVSAVGTKVTCINIATACWVLLGHDGSIN